VVLEMNEDQMDKSVENKISRRDKEERNIPYTIKKQANLISHILLRKHIIKHVVKGKIRKVWM
jgi:hypothetical protein